MVLVKSTLLDQRVNFCDLHFGGEKKSWVLAALDALELGSAHTTALTHLLGTPGIPGLLLGEKTQHYILHLSKQKYLRVAEEGDSWMAKATHLSKPCIYPEIFWAVGKTQLKPDNSPSCSCSWVGSTGRESFWVRRLWSYWDFTMEIDFMQLIRTGNTSCFLSRGEH